MKPIGPQPSTQATSGARSGPRAEATRSVIVQAEDPQDMATLTRDLSRRSPGARVTGELPLIGAVELEVTPEALQSLSDRKIRVFDNAPVHLIEPFEQAPDEAGVQGEVGALLNSAVASMNADKLWQRGLSGEGVTVAVLDTGIAPHPDMKDRIVGFFDAINGQTAPYDDQGHGTHVAGIVAGDGTSSGGSFTGVAPKAALVGIKALDRRGSGTTAGIIRGIQWAVQNKEKYGIQVLNMSLGGPIQGSYKDDPLVQAVEAANRAGIVCVLAAGNSGPSTSTVASPGNAPNAITVGASDDRGTPSRADDQIAPFSSRGPTSHDKLIKPDVVAPGVKITSADHDSPGYVTFSGTSMATPATAGLIALLLEGHPGSTPEQIKAALMTTAEPMKDQGDANHQGSGLVDAVKAEARLGGSQGA